MGLTSGQKYLSDTLIQNIIDGKADIEKLLPMFKREPGRGIRLLRIAETQLRFFKTHPEIEKRNLEKKERMEGIVDLIKEECIHKTKKIIPIRPEPVKPAGPVIQSTMPERKEPMSFEEEFAEKFKKEIDLIRQNTNRPEFTEKEIVKTLIRSISKIPGGAEPADSPIYRVIHYVATHRDELAKIKEKMLAYNMIADGAKYDGGNTRFIINNYGVIMPEHLIVKKHRKSKEEKKEEPPKEVIIVEEVDYTPHHEPALPPKEYLTPVGRMTKPIETVIMRKPREYPVGEETKTVEAVKTIEAKDAREIVIKAQGVEIVIKLTGMGISVGTATTEIPKPEPVEEKKLALGEVKAFDIRYTAKNRVCFCYGCGKNIAEPTVAIVKMKADDDKAMPFHVGCTGPGNTVRFTRKKE